MPTSSPIKKKVWGVPSGEIQTELSNVEKQSKVSFQDIVDETLAIKMQEMEIQQEFVVVDSPQDPSTSAPLSPSSRVTVVGGNEVAFEDVPSEELDADFALALQLQAQEEQDYQTHLEKFRNQNSGNVNVVSREDPFAFQLRDSVSYNSKKYSDLCGPSNSSDSHVHTQEHSNHQKAVHSALKDNGIDSNVKVMSKSGSNPRGWVSSDNVEKRHDVVLGHEFRIPSKVLNGLKENLRKGDSIKGVSIKGRVEAAKRSTSEGVLDERTRLLLFKLTNKGELDAVHGIVGTGKESNVYYGERSQPISGSVAVKVFKTTLTEFRNRREYVTGDHRFASLKNKFHNKNTINQANIWANKEFRNLCRAYKSGVACPEPLLHSEYILLMEFLGKNGYPAPCLNQIEWIDSTDLDSSLGEKSIPVDADTDKFGNVVWGDEIGRSQSEESVIAEAEEDRKKMVKVQEKLFKVYAQVLFYLRVLYQSANLVHADLSEYNILYFKRSVYFIDFGQAVDCRSHPRAEEFLRRDIANVNAYFSNCGMVQGREHGNILAADLIYDYVTSSTLEDGSVDADIPQPFVEVFQSIKPARGLQTKE